MRAARVAGVLLAVGVLVAGCTSDPGPGPEPTGGSTTASGSTGYTVEEFAAEVLGDGAPDELDVVGQVSGTLPDGEPVQVGVVAVRADASGTTLELTVRGDFALGSMRGWSSGPLRSYDDIRGVEVVDESAGGWRLQPYTLRQDDEPENHCACAMFPRTLQEDRPVTLSAVLPPLPAGVTTVTVAVPGLDPVTSVPVTWE